MLIKDMLNSFVERLVKISSISKLIALELKINNFNYLKHKLQNLKRNLHLTIIALKIKDKVGIGMIDLKISQKMIILRIIKIPYNQFIINDAFC